MAEIVRTLLVLVLLITGSSCFGWAAEGDYLGAAACGECHEEIFRRQSRSRMARTWRQFGQDAFHSNYSRSVGEEGLEYRVEGGPEGLVFSVRDAAGGKLSAPVAHLTGGERFGVGFLLRVESLAGMKLLRPILLEARFMHDLERDRLVLAPGHEQRRPYSLPSALGRVLEPGFEQRCLTCHGSPQHTPSGAAGIHCERCHGPGGRHLKALETGSDDSSIVNPGGMDNRQLVEFCGQCHSGFFELTQPRPQDLLITEQARALSLSECFVQSGAGFSCLSCHDPHQDAAASDPRYERTCLSCHALGTGPAAPCPVNQRSNCVGCHMPKVVRGDLPLLDHWIRVPGNLKGKYPLAKGLPHSRVEPKRIFLRLLTAQTRELAEQLHGRVASGEDFAQLATQYSSGPSAELGGFLGALETSRLHPALQDWAGRLGFGQSSEVVELDGSFVLVQRLTRDFREEAYAFEIQGSLQVASSRVDDGIVSLLSAVRVYPRFLKGYHSLAHAYGVKGDIARLIETLRKAEQLFPEDPATPFLLARAYGIAGRPDLQALSLSEALSLDPESVPAHVMRGSLYFARQRWDDAARHFERAAHLNPLSAIASFKLGQTRTQQGRQEEARRWLELANTLSGRRDAQQ